MTSQQTLLSPAELAYLHSSLSLRPPIRPDGRTPTQFRPLTAETGILPGTNGSARVCLSDGTEAIVGVKAEIEKTADPLAAEDEYRQYVKGTSGKGGGDGEEDRREARGDWLEMTVEVPGQRDDDASTVFLAEMLREALLVDGEFAKKLWINRRFHWRLYLDVSLSMLPEEFFLPFFTSSSSFLLLCYVYSEMCWHGLTLFFLSTDSTNIAAAFIPFASTLAHYTPRPTVDETAKAKIRR